MNEDVLVDDGRDELDWDEGGERVREGFCIRIEGLEVCEVVILFIIMEELLSKIGHKDEEDRFRFIAMALVVSYGGTVRSGLQTAGGSSNFTC